MRIRYITIEREYGSGGTRIGRLTAEKCGIRCYGPEILREVARINHTSTEFLEDYEERVSGSLLYSMFVMTQAQTGDPDLVSDESKLYVAESRVITRFSKDGPAVFVGHCAGEALRDQPGVLRVFIHGSEEDKLRRIVKDYGIPPEEVAAVCRKMNRRRSNYYHFCTRQRWQDYTGYDLVLNSSTLGLEGCAAALAALYEQGR